MGASYTRLQRGVLCKFRAVQICSTSAALVLKFLNLSPYHNIGPHSFRTTIIWWSGILYFMYPRTYIHGLFSRFFFSSPNLSLSLSLLSYAPDLFHHHLELY